MAGAPIVVTKIEPPALRAGHVRRARLVERLQADGPRRLTLVVAPAGSGKSTLLAEWRAACEGRPPFAWLALDAADNDPVRFWTHVLAALASAGVAVPEALRGALAAPGARAIEVVLPQLVNALAAGAVEVVLAIDDYHLVTEPEIHEGMAFLLAHGPAGARVAIASRTLPPLGVARLRANGELSEVRADALRFRDDEAAELLNGTLALGLAPGDIDGLQSRTEGWAAGVYLAGLSLRDADDRPAAIAAFTGTDRHLVDYLAEETLAGLDADTRAFLLETSILDALSPALCDAVRGRGGSRGVLERLERSNLFLVPLDPAHEWFRYHHLFGAVLQRELETVADLAHRQALHARAAEWHAAHGDTTAAVHHALLAGQPALAGALVARDWNAHLQRGRIATVHRWLDELPTELVEADAQLCLARAWILFDSGELPLVERWVAAAERADDGRGLRDGGQSVVAAAAMLRATRAYVDGDLGAAARLAEAAAALERDPASAWRAVALATLGTGTYWTGGTASAVAVLEEAVGLERAGTNNLATLRALGMLAVIALDLDDPDTAAAWVARLNALRRRESLEEYPMGACASAVEGQLAAAAGDVHGALASLERAAVLARRGGARADLLYVLGALVGVTAVVRGAEAARDVLREARRVAASCPDPGVLGHALDDAERRLRGRPVASAAAPADLSERELAVLRLLPSPLTFAEIAGTLYVSKNTVRSHAQSIYRKLGVESRAEAVTSARRHGLL